MMRSSPRGFWAVALALAVHATGCSPKAASPPDRGVQGPSAAAAPPAAPGTASGSVEPPAPPLPAMAVLAARVNEAYLQRAHGEAAKARAAFEEIVQLFVRAGQPPVLGLGTAHGFAVPGKSTAGFTVESGGEKGTLFFDLASGEPFAFARDLALRVEGPAVDAPFFVWAGRPGRRLGFYDPTTERFLDPPGTLIAVHPDGHRGYVLDEHCRVQEWTIATARATRALGSHRSAAVAAGAPEGSSAGCDPHAFEDAAITADGLWLTTRRGRWNLATGVLQPLPFSKGSEGYEPAVSPDGRYVARVRSNPASTNEGDKTLLVLHDLDRGTVVTAKRKLHFLSNGDPLSFGAHPLRLCVFDYGFYPFAVPSMTAFEENDSVFDPGADRSRFGPESCQTWFLPPPARHLDLVARMAARVCSASGFLLPREHCEPRP